MWEIVEFVVVILVALILVVDWLIPILRGLPVGRRGRMAKLEAELKELRAEKEERELSEQITQLRKQVTPEDQDAKEGNQETSN